MSSAARKELSTQNPLPQEPPPFRNEGEIKSSSDKENREFVSHSSTIKEQLEKFTKQKGNDKRKTPGTSGKKGERDKQKYMQIS